MDTVGCSVDSRHGRRGSSLGDQSRVIIWFIPVYRVHRPCPHVGHSVSRVTRWKLKCLQVVKGSSILADTRRYSPISTGKLNPTEFHQLPTLCLPGSLTLFLMLRVILSSGLLVANVDFSVSKLSFNCHIYRKRKDNALRKFSYFFYGYCVLNFM